MGPEKDKPPAESARLFRDLRVRNERRAELAQARDVENRRRIARVVEVARHRRFRHGLIGKS